MGCRVRLRTVAGMLAVAVMLIGAFAGQLRAAEEVASLEELIVLGLKTNLGLRVEQLQVRGDALSVAIEDAVFDPELYSAAGFSRQTAPYVTTTADGRLTSRETFAEIGLRKGFTTGLTGSLSLRTERLSGEDLTSALDPGYRNALLLELRQPLLRQRGTDINTTDLQRFRYRLQQTELGYLLQAQTLALQLETAVRSLAAQEQTVALRQQALVLADQLLKANQKRFDEGLVPITEVQEAQAARAARELRYAQSLQQQQELQVQLRRHLNWQLPADFRAQPLIARNSSSSHLTVTAPDVASSLVVAREKRLDLQVSRLSIKISEVQQNYLKNQLQPQLDLRLLAGLNGLAGRNDNAPDHAYRGGFVDSFDSLGQADGHHLRAAVEFSVPLGNRAARSRLLQAQTITRQQQYRLADLDAQLALEVEEQVINFDHSARQLTLADEFQRLATIALEQEQRRIEAGLSDTFRLLSFQDNMIDARIDRLQAAVRHQLARARLAYVRGEVLERYTIALPVRMEGLTP